jgi:hypothetical protein
MKRILFSLAVISVITAFTAETAHSTTIAGNVAFEYKFQDLSWTSGLTYDVYVMVIANGNQYSSYPNFATISAPGDYPGNSVYLSDIPYPSPITPYTYQIYVYVTRSDGHFQASGWAYGAVTSYTPFVLTANNPITLQ